MWTLTPFGFYSAVRKRGDAHLTIRARVAADLDELRERYLPTLTPTQAGGGTDYPFRATCNPEAWGDALAAMGRDIDYANFKSEVAKQQGWGREAVYAQVWTALRTLEATPAPRRAPAPAPTPAAPPRPPERGGVAGSNPHPQAERHPSGKARAAGGVLIDADGRVLLRKVANNYDGEGWTFAKGRPNTGESMEAAALREVLEETGVRAELVAPLPGEHPGSATVTRYWRMRPLEDTRRFGPETEAVAWVTPDEARHRIRTTTTKAHKVKRDLEVLALALADWERAR